MASSPTDAPPPTDVLGEAWSWLQRFFSADPPPKERQQPQAEQNEAPQIEPHNNLLHGPKGSVDKTGADLLNMIKPVNDLLVYTYWLYGRQGTLSAHPYGRTTILDEQKLAGIWDDRIKQLKDNIHLTGSMAEASARQLHTL